MKYCFEVEVRGPDDQLNNGEFDYEGHVVISGTGGLSIFMVDVPKDVAVGDVGDAETFVLERFIDQFQKAMDLA